MKKRDVPIQKIPNPNSEVPNELLFQQFQFDHRLPRNISDFNRLGRNVDLVGYQIGLRETLSPDIAAAKKALPVAPKKKMKE